MGSIALALDPKMVNAKQLSRTLNYVDIENHVQEFNRTFNSFVNETAIFAERFVVDHRARFRYQNLVRESARHIIQSIERGDIQLQEAARTAAKLRNEYLSLIRNIGSDIGRVVAQFKKKEGRTLEYLLDFYSRQKFTTGFSDLQFENQKQIVYRAVIESSGRANEAVNEFAKFLGKAGKGLAIVSAAMIVYHVCESEDKWGTIAETGTGMGFGYVMAAAGGWAGTFCGPAAIACVPLGVFIGSLLGALGADVLFHWRD